MFFHMKDMYFKKIWIFYNYVLKNTWDIANLRGVKKKGFSVIIAARHWIIRNKKNDHKLMT